MENNKDYPDIHSNKIIGLLKNIKGLSDKYHRMSLLFHELHQSMYFEAAQGKKYAELAKILNKFDLTLIKDYSRIKLSRFKKEMSDE